MAKDDKTICDGDATVPENNPTMLDDVNVTMLDDGAATVPGVQPADSDAGTACIENGVALLDTYRVESDAIEGGMGKVWRVRHAGWNVDLAMKQPKAALFQSQQQKDNFIHECEAWINLGLHPHIVSCYYVREINGIPTIFSEWMDGGSLKDAIESGSLYDGSEAEQQERLLDIAIQFARGLHYAHECRDENGQPMGLIHQDVKPDNLLLTKDGEAKVADFGISKARALLTVLEGNEKEQAAYADSGGTMYAASGGYTPAYCSMEQMNGLRLTRRTDIYSWAVSVLEMYLGDRSWANGVIAGAACESYFPEARVAVSAAMQALLTECLNEDEAKRPHDFAVVEEKLLAIVKAETGHDYPRPASKAAADTSDSLNNRALSFLDLGKPEEARLFMHKALSVNSDHPEANYNLMLLNIRSFRDEAKRTTLSDPIKMFMRVKNNLGTLKTQRLLSQLYAEMGEYETALRLLRDAEDRYDETNDIKILINRIKDCILPLEASYDVKGKPLRAWLLQDGRRLLVFSAGDDRFHLFNTESGQRIGGSGQTTISDMKFTYEENRRKREIANKFSGICTDTACNRLLVYYGHNWTLWDMQSERMMCSQPINNSDGIFAYTQLSPDGLSVLYIFNMSLYVVDAKTGKALKGYPRKGVSAARFRADGSVETMAFDSNNEVRRKTLIAPDHYHTLIPSRGYEEGVDLMRGNQPNPMHSFLWKEGLIGAGFDRLGRLVTMRADEAENCVKLYAVEPTYYYEKAADFELCRIITIRQTTANVQRLKNLVSSANVAIDEGDIPSALALIEQGRAIPDYFSDDSFCRVAMRVGSFCIPKTIRAFKLISNTVPYKSGGGHRWDLKCHNANVYRVLSNGRICVIDEWTGQVQQMPEPQNEAASIFEPNCVAIDPAHGIYLHAIGPMLALFEMNTGQKLQALTIPEDLRSASVRATSACFGKDNRVYCALTTTDCNGCILEYSINEGNLIRRFDGILLEDDQSNLKLEHGAWNIKKQNIIRLAISPDGSALFYAKEMPGLLPGPRPTYRLPLKGAGLIEKVDEEQVFLSSDFSFSSDGCLMLVAAGCGEAFLYQTDNLKKPIAQFETPSSRIEFVSFCKGGRFALYNASNENFMVFPIKTNSCTSPQYTKPVFSAKVFGDEICEDLNGHLIAIGKGLNISFVWLDWEYEYINSSQLTLA